MDVLFGLRKRSDIITIDPELLAVAQPSPDETVEFLITNQPERAPALIYTCLHKCNDSSFSNLQICAYFCSALRAMFTDLDNEIRSAMAGMGAELVIIDDSHITPFDFDLLVSPGRLHSIILIAASVLVLFKNINSSTFDRYFTDRIRALKELVGCFEPLTATGDMVLKIDAAALIKTMLGAQHNLRAALLDFMLQERSHDIATGKAFGHVAKMIEWTDMSSFAIIREELLLTGSPVISDVRVASEAMALSQIFSIVNKTESPQYYRIYNPITGIRLMNKGRYPILLKVASICKSVRYESGSKFNSGGKQLISELVDIHNAYMRTRARTVAPAPVRNLFTFDPEGLWQRLKKTKRQ